MPRTDVPRTDVPRTSAAKPDALAPNRRPQEQSLDHRLAHLLAETDWVARRRDLIAGGVSSSSIDRRLRSGVLRSFVNGVVGLSTPPDERRQALRAATLAKPRGVLSHLTAAEVHGVDFERLPRAIHLTVPHGTSRAGRGLIAHQTHHLPEVDRVEIDGLPVTSAARTLCDLAGGGSLATGELRALLTWMLDHDRCTPDDIEACSEAMSGQGRHGTAGRRRLLHWLRHGARHDLDELAASFDDLAESAGFVASASTPEWLPPAAGMVARFVADRLVVELDGRGPVRQLHQVRDDRHRDDLARANRTRLVRFTWEEVDGHPEEVARHLVHLLGERAAA